MYGESLMGKFVDLVALSARERPRRASLKALVRLRRSLLDCQDVYARYSARAADLGVERTDPWGSRDEHLYRLYERWLAATHNVLMDVGDLAEELEILSPDTIYHLRQYGDREANGVQAAAHQMGVTVDDELEEYRFEHRDGRPPEGSSFGHAIAHLDEFIRSEFTADELRAAL